MSKISIKAYQKNSLDEYTYEGYAIKSKNRLIYNDNGIKTIVEYLKDQLIITRLSSEYKIKLILNLNSMTEAICTYQHITFKIPIKTVILNVTPYKIETHYFIDKEFYEYILEY